MSDDSNAAAGNASWKRRSLNERAFQVLNAATTQRKYESLGVAELPLACGATVIDFGVDTSGSLQAGLLLARLCMAGLGEVTLAPGQVDGLGFPTVQVQTDDPVEACLLSQYAGWRVSVGDYFGMGSGPMRAAAAREELFEKLPWDESPESVLGVLEASSLPDEKVVSYLAERCGVAPNGVTLAVAPTASMAGTIQVVARSVETSLHKLFELGFDVQRIVSGFGTAPLPPVAKDDLAGIGRTNDAILYGGRVTLWVTGDDESLTQIGPKVPASAAEGYGKPFIDIFREAGHDFYKIDPMLFSPAEIIFHNIETGSAFCFGDVAPAVLRQSFGV
ncbi:MAG: methenyltetrahydromethanopterin cyclohydrolase [Planctomycetaceae bacterium]|nr:methenyltetrahydromethanopterin cyclohydrolase [Planctomycetaceae bacterium]